MRSFFSNKEINNATWMIGGKMLQMIVNFLVGILSARYLGPSNYGLISYASTYVAFFTVLCSLGINLVIIKDFLDNPDEQGMAIGTALILRLASGGLSLLTLFAVVSCVDYGERITITVVMLSAISLLFSIFDTLNCWFQYIYQAKTVAIASLSAYMVMALYKLYLLTSGKSVIWFALATSIDYLVIALVLSGVYIKMHGPKWRGSWKKGRHLLRKSYPYLLSGIMTSVYAQTDKLMLKQMMSQAEVGYYSMAVSVCGIWTFVLAAIIDAVFPTIYRAYKSDLTKFENKNRQLYAIVIYLSVIASIFFSLFGETAILILYGESYIPAYKPLKIITWGTAFSYLGVARQAWLVCKNTQRYLTVIYLLAAIMNVVMNYFLIPIMGASGAAIASVLAQICTSVVIPMFIKQLRPNVKLMFEALLLRDIGIEKKRLDAE